MAEIWIDEIKLYIKATTAREVRILEDAEEKGLIKKCDGIHLEDLDVVWEIEETGGL